MRVNLTGREVWLVARCRAYTRGDSKAVLGVQLQPPEVFDCIEDAVTYAAATAAPGVITGFYHVIDGENDGTPIEAIDSDSCPLPDDDEDSRAVAFAPEVLRRVAEVARQRFDMMEDEARGHFRG